MSIAGNIPSLRRKLKDVAYNHSDAQVKVREATSNDPWGPSSTIMSEIADMSYNAMAFTEIMHMVWKRLNDHGKNWRHVYKALVLLDYLVKTGSEKVAQQCKENIYAIQTLKDFQYVEENKDQGMNVREKAKQLVAILKDEERLRNERTRALMAKKRFDQNGMGISSDGSLRGGRRSDSYPGQSGSDDPANPELEEVRPSTAGEEELQLQIALALSREEAQREEEVRKGDDARLAMALSESKSVDVVESPSSGSQNQKAQSHSALDDLLGLNPPMGAVGGSPVNGAMGGMPPSADNDPWSAFPPLSSGGGGGAVNGLSGYTPAAATSGASAWATPVLPPPSGASGGAHRGGFGATDPWGAPVDVGGRTGGATSAPTVGGMDSATNDPWAPVTSNNGFTESGNNDPWNMDPLSGDLLALSGGDSRNGAMTNGNQNGEMLQMGPGRNLKTPESFLGDNANLVNLDNLMGAAGKVPMGITPAKSTPLTNPFAPAGAGPYVSPSLGMGGTSAAAASATNPFAAQQRPSPTLNEMRTSAVGGSGGAIQWSSQSGGTANGGGTAGQSFNAQPNPGWTLPPPLEPQSGAATTTAGGSGGPTNPFL